MIYAFLPEFSRGLGVPIAVIVVLLSGLSALSTIAPLFGRLPDRLGSRQAMYVGLGLFALGTLIVIISPTFPGLVLALGLCVLAKIIYDPALLAYFSHQVSYSRRGRVLAVTEMSWSLPMLVGMPMIGWLMAHSNPPETAWQAPFPFLASLTIVAAVVLRHVLPHEEYDRGKHRSNSGPRWTTILSDKCVMGGLVVCFLIHSAQENLSVVYGAWLEESFGLALAALGLATSVIGIAELIGEGGVMAIADRLGKRRAVAWGIGLSMVSYIALPFLGTNLVGALLGLFAAFLSFEFTMVALIPLMSELVPEARAPVMSATISAQSSGRMVGALIGGGLLSAGMTWTGIAAASLNGIAMLVLIIWVRDQDAPSENRKSPSV